MSEEVESPETGLTGAVAAVAVALAPFINLHAKIHFARAAQLDFTPPKKAELARNTHV